MSYFHLFAYGTLADPRASPARDLLDGCERVGEASVRGTLFDAGDYPALILDGADSVPGVIWRCPADALPRLDRHEEVSERLFRRVALRVRDLPCWTYVAGPRLGPYLTPERRLDTRADGVGTSYLGNLSRP
jgi:gamma-glutamylcyclotransferase (GGCT)/AIG2-like uncharacterized protein YtfP